MDLDNTVQASVASAGTLPEGEPQALSGGDSFGRYVVLAELGAGGMGVVYAAHDPELDRKVALKLLHPRPGAAGDGGRARLLREAQALAKLSHPNVVAVHDVGQRDDRVWIAMEFVAGTTLGAWAAERPRRWQEVVPVLRDAARGVAAAHAVGLVHRDLKPDNVMLGEDGRVRVMDFGLAHGRNLPATEPERMATLPASALVRRLTVVGSIQGTPAYMAPEQWLGQEAEAAADQFGWSVMAWELLYGELPWAATGSWEALKSAVLAGRRRAPPGDRKVPRWLRLVVERGLARDPAERWPTMAALLAALERGRARARGWRVAAALAGVVALGAGAEGGRRWQLAQRVAACEATGADIDAVWSEQARQRLRDAFAATGVGYAATAAERVTPWLDRQAAAWRQARVLTCMNVEVHGSWDEALAGGAVSCLEDRAVELDALVAEFGRANATTVQKAVSAAVRLGPVDACVDAGALRRRPPVPDEGRGLLRELRAELSRAHSLGLAGRYQDALAVATGARERAESELRWRPLVAAARVQEGELLHETGAFARAEAALTDGYFEAAGAGAWAEAALAAIKLINTVGFRQARYADGRAWARHAGMAIEHAGDPAGLMEANRLNLLSIVLRTEDGFTEARALAERALAIREQALGPGHPDVAASLSGIAAIATATHDLAEAQALHERVLAALEQELGPDHPDLAQTLTNLANIRCDSGAYAEARPLYQRALALLEHARGPEHPDVATGLNNLATAYEAEQAYAEARPLYERALAIWERALGPEHPDVAISLSNLALLNQKTGDHATARALNERALAIWEQVLGPEHPNVAVALGNLGFVHFSLGSYAQARALHGRAAAIWEKARGPDSPELALSLVFAAHVELAEKQPRAALGLVERAARIFDGHAGKQAGESDAQFILAQALVDTQGDRARAIAAARRARDAYREVGPAAVDDVAEIERWLAAHDG